MDPATAAIIASTIAAAASSGSAYLANQGANKESKMERTKRKLVDQLIGSVGGEGPFADLFSFDEGAFQKSFVEPAQAMFRNQIAPQIQQQYIASGQQRGTGLDDTLTRAGVDLDSLLNQHLMQYQEAGKNRALQGISSVFGVGGSPAQLSGGEAATQGLGGYFSSPGFTDILSDTVSSYMKPKTPSIGQSGQIGQRKGFEYNPNINYGVPTK